MKERKELRSNPALWILYREKCRETRENLIIDIAKKKEKVTLDAIRKGKSVTKEARKIEHKRNRLNITDKDGKMSQKNTKEKVKKFYNELFKKTIPTPRINPQSQENLEPLPCFLLSEIRSATISMKLGVYYFLVKCQKKR